MDQTEVVPALVATSSATGTGLARPQSVEEIVARGRTLARLAVGELIEEVQRRANDHQLDRGLHLSLPYYDDRRLALRRRDFTVIPRGRILFVPAFVVIAAERELDRVRQDRQFTDSTRRHLLGLLELLRCSFAGPESQ